jgi:exonuclease III
MLFFSSTFTPTCASSFFQMQCSDPQILSWNVRGLNDVARCLAVHETLAATPCQIAYLQETKLHTIDGALAEFLGAFKLRNFAFKPAEGTRGGFFFYGTTRKFP